MEMAVTRRGGHFGINNTHNITSITTNEAMIYEDMLDPGEYLYEQLLQQLELDSLGFKAKLYKLSEFIKSGNPWVTFKKECGKLTKADILEAEKMVSWDCGEFVTSVIMNLTTPVDDVDSKKVSTFIKDNSHIFDPENRRVTTLENAFEMSLSKVEKGQHVVLGVFLYDGLNPDAHAAPDTFVHSFSMVITLNAVFIYQVFQKGHHSIMDMQTQDSIRMTHQNARNFVATLTSWMKSSVESKGKWTETANRLFQELFHVDLIALEKMELNMIFDPYLLVEMHHFSTSIVHENLKLLPALTPRVLRSITPEELHAVHHPPVSAHAHHHRPSMEMHYEEHESGGITISTSTSTSLYGSMSASSAPLFTPHGTSPLMHSRAKSFRAHTPKFIDYPYPDAKEDLPPEPLRQTCAYCKFSSSCSIYKCRRCKNEDYCCAEHERKHLAVHKDSCQAWADIINQRGFR